MKTNKKAKSGKNGSLRSAWGMWAVVVLYFLIIPLRGENLAVFIALICAAVIWTTALMQKDISPPPYLTHPFDERYF